MARSMFEYTKMVLTKVSFDVHLFSRELKKASKHLLPYELEELKRWLLTFTENKPELSGCINYLR